MSTNLATKAQNWDGNRQEFISQKMEDLHRILQLYSPTYDVVFNPEGKQIAGVEYNFAILEAAPGKEPYIVRFLTTEMLDNPTSIRDWVAQGDLRRQRPQDVLARIEAEEARVAREKMNARSDVEHERQDFVTSAIRGGTNRLHTFRHGGRKYE